MNSSIADVQLKDRIVPFVWQHLLLLASLYIMTFGVALCVRSGVGSSVISTIPFVMTLAGESGMALAYTIGEYTYIMNFILVGLQILVLRRRFQTVQLFQLLLGFVFGFLLDVNMAVTSPFETDAIPGRLLLQFIGCTVLAVGICFEIKCGSLTMPGEGITIAIAQVSGAPFGKTKIRVDIGMVVIAVALGYAFFGAWLGQVVGVGTLFAMVYVGAVVRFLEPYMGWFSKIVLYRPGIRRYVYGLARFIHNRMN